jgi:lysophospholipase L1-like esterase
MKKQWIAIVVSSTLAAAAVMGVVRLTAPQLLGLPLDLELVQSSVQAVPFFDVVLNPKEIGAEDIYLKDPYLKQRYRPLDKKQPTDLLGFRNAGVPNTIDVLAVGDSQTWGDNANLRNTWPGQLARLTSDKKVSVYNASLGGWGAVQYLEIIQRMLLFKPKIVVVAFYTGNDPLDSYAMGYASERWASLRPSDLPKKVKPPHVNYPPKKDELWSVEFDDGVKTVFTPHGRYACNLDHPAANAGWVIMENVARRIAAMTKDAGVSPFFTIIPTKELVFYPRIQQENLKEDETYHSLVQAEAKRIEKFSALLRGLPSAEYVDVVSPMQQAVLNTTIQYYPKDQNGHPTGAGYGVIAKAAASQIEPFL